jgi:hypothetical protein
MRRLTEPTKATREYLRKRDAMNKLLEKAVTLDVSKILTKPAVKRQAAAP